MQAIIATPAYNRSEITTNAWEIFRKLGKTFSDAMKAAWAKTKEVVGKLNIDVAKLAELSLDELTGLQAAISATIDAKKAGIEQPEKRYAHHIKLEEKNGKVYTTSHYNSCFIEKARGLRGQWNVGQWVFDGNVRDHVVAAMEGCYSVTGIVPYEVCTLVVKDYYEEEWTGGVELFGRPVAKAFGRDSGAKAQDGIFLISGRFKSGGSVKNWKTIIDHADFEMHDFPVAALEREDVKKAIAEGWAEVK
jgi:hypothetical protein